MRQVTRSEGREPLYRRIGSVVLVGLALTAAVACSESGLAAGDGAASVMASMSPNSIRLVESRGRTWTVNRADPFACFTSTASTGPIPYLYKRHSLTIPRGVAKAAGAIEAMSYRVLDSKGKVLSVLNCTIPASTAARELVAERFNLFQAPDDPGTAAAFDCAAIESDGDCQLAPVHAGSCGPGWTGEYPNCRRAYEPQCPALDPSCGGFGGGGDPGASGGGGSCTDCGPSTPTLSCPAVTRGESVRCVVSDGTSDLPSTNWRFSASGRTPITGPDGSSWYGLGVLSGTVSAVPVAYGTPLQATLSVRARNWKWSSAVMSYSQGTGAICDTNVPGYGGLVGWNLTRGNTTCVGEDNFPIQPDPRRTTTGKTLVRALSGPNMGIAYVNSLSYRIDRESNQNPAVQLGGPALALKGTDATKCGASASFHGYNTCRGINMNAFLNGVWYHEGNGTTGANGHYSTMVRAAAQAGNDPYALTESLVSADGESVSDFGDRVQAAVTNSGYRIYNASSDASGFVTGNWSGPIWIWNPTTGTFLNITMSI